MVSFSPLTPTAGILPPARFAPATSIEGARLHVRPRLIKEPSGSAAQQAGVRFESAVTQVLDKSGWHIEPQLMWQQGVKTRSAYPDAVRIERSARKGIVTDIIAVEIKNRHSIDAFLQLYQLYRPVLHAIYPDAAFRAIIIVPSIDPLVTLPKGFSSRILGDSLRAVPPWPVVGLKRWVL